MVEAIVKKIMLTGVKKYSKLLNSNSVQIKVVDNPNGTIFYKICDNFKEKETVTLLNIMDKKMDLLGYEAMANPFMKKSLITCAEENDADVSKVTAFIMQRNEEIYLAFYNEFKNVKTATLSSHLRSIGL